MTAESISLLEKYRIGWVMVDAGGRWPSSQEIITARYIYIWLHGPDGSYATGYTMQAVRQLAKKCHSWQAKGLDCWVFFNNDIDGHAVQNSKQLQKMIEAAKDRHAAMGPPR